jgi:hypothetical protein
MVRIICLVYVIYVRANKGWRLLVSMIIVYWFGIEKVVMYDHMYHDDFICCVDDFDFDFLGLFAKFLHVGMLANET